MKFSAALITSVAVGATALPNIAPAHENRGALNWLGARQGPEDGFDGGFGQQSESFGPRPTGGFGGPGHGRGRGPRPRPTGGFGGDHSRSAEIRPTGRFGGDHSRSVDVRPTGGFGQESGSLGLRPTDGFGLGTQSAGIIPTRSFGGDVSPTGAPVDEAQDDEDEASDEEENEDDDEDDNDNDNSPDAPTTTSAPSSSENGSGSSGALPASYGTSTLAAAQTIAAGESFDGGMFMIDRGVSCTDQGEGGDSDAVFILENGASLSNVIIGPNQIEGVHCRGACTLTNVWWRAVCEDAFTIKEQADGETTTITGGGAFGAEDKVLQHNGGGTLSVYDFYVEDFGKLYRSCGNCKSMPERHVIMDGITAVSGKALVGINSNMGDTATLTNIVATDVGDICVRFEGVTDGSEPSKIGSGPDSEACLYSESDVTSP